MKCLRKAVEEFARRAELRLYRKHEIGRYDGIALVDLYDYTPYFEKTLVGALELIKNTNPKHFARVLRYMRCIVNCTLPRGGTTYRYTIRTCEIDFKPPASDHELPYLIAWYACILVHSATFTQLPTGGSVLVVFPIDPSFAPASSNFASRRNSAACVVLRSVPR
jgi:hypothetical protein